MLEVKIIIIFVISLIITVSWTSTSITNAQQNSSQTSIENVDNQTALSPFNDAKKGFSLSYPSNWTINDTKHDHSTVVSFESPGKNVSVDIRIFPQESYKSIKDYGKKVFKQSYEIPLLEYNTTDLAGRPAIKAIYLGVSHPDLTGRNLGYLLSTPKAMMVATLVPEKTSIFAIAYFAQISNFDQYLPAVEKLINSFQINQ